MLAHERHGSGPPLVLLHGTNSSRAMWRPILTKLAAARDVVAVDLPAHGDSPPTSLTPPDFARVERSLRTPLGRRLGLRSISARPGDVPEDIAVSSARTAIASRHFPAHFRRTRVLRFTGGRQIPPTVPVTVVWGEQDRVAQAGRARFRGELPAHARVETWPDCGHMMVWDRGDATIAATPAVSARAGGQ